MILNLISLATVKTELGFSDTTNDAEITAMIPKVSSDVRRILNCGFDNYVYAIFDSSADTIDMEHLNYVIKSPMIQPRLQQFELGSVVYHPNLPADTYLKSYDPDTGLYTLSATPTDAGAYAYVTVNIAQWKTISKMIWYRISNLSTSDVNQRLANSISYGPVSKSFSDKEINKQWNYPQVLIDDLGVPYARIG